MKQDGYRKFSDEDEAHPSTPVEKTVKRHKEKYKGKI